MPDRVVYRYSECFKTGSVGVYPNGFPARRDYGNAVFHGSLLAGTEGIC
jgi:hypothetical protein